MTAKKDKWNALPECSRCKTLMKKKVFKIMGFEVKGWECPRCKEVLYIGDDLNRVLVENKLRKGIPVKVGVLGNSFMMRIPKEISFAFNIKKGKELILKVKGKELMVEI